MDWHQLRIDTLGEENQTVLPPDIKLPALPKAVMEFSQKAEDPNATNKLLGSIIESDAGLTAELLKFINSSAVGMKKQISSTAQAISLIGIKPTKQHLLVTAASNMMQSCKSKLINFQVFWNTNYERALLAREIAEILGTDADVAFAGALLQDFVLPILTNERFEEYLEYTTREEGDTTELIAYENTKLGWDHTKVASYLMTSWGFSDELICTVMLHHRGLRILGDPDLRQTPAAAVALSALMPDPLHQTPSGLDQLVRLDQSWGPFDLLAVAQRVQNALDEEAPIKATNHISFLRRVEKVCVSTEEDSKTE